MNKKYWFKCDNNYCNHDFYICINDMTRQKSSWCPYCSTSNKRLCNNENCQVCFDNSFASFKGTTKNGKLKVDCWDYEKNGDDKPRNYTISSGKKCWFKCEMDNHSFCLHLFNLTLGQDFKLIIRK